MDSCTPAEGTHSTYMWLTRCLLSISAEHPSSLHITKWKPQSMSVCSSTSPRLPCHWQPLSLLGHFTLKLRILFDRWRDLEWWWKSHGLLDILECLRCTPHRTSAHNWSALGQRPAPDRWDTWAPPETLLEYPQTHTVLHCSCRWPWSASALNMWDLRYDYTVHGNLLGLYCMNKFTYICVPHE